jgi:hypothetical protein
MAPLRYLGDSNSNLLDHSLPCPGCGQPLEGFWFARAEKQKYPVTIRLGSELPGTRESAPTRLPAYSCCGWCFTNIEGAVLLEGRRLASLEIERVDLNTGRD